MDFDIPCRAQGKDPGDEDGHAQPGPDGSRRPAEITVTALHQGIKPRAHCPKHHHRDGLITEIQGERITLDFQNADIHNILRIIADVSGLNIVTSDEVKGTVTIRGSRMSPGIRPSMSSWKARTSTRWPSATSCASLRPTRSRRHRSASLHPRRPRSSSNPGHLGDPGEFRQGVRHLRHHQGKEVGLLSERGNITAENRTNVLIVKISGQER